MIKILSIVGARPQFVKAAVLSRRIREDAYKDQIQEILVHTGQHYDQNMSDLFFEEMQIPKPDHNLAVGSGSHGAMTGEMLIKIEELIFQEKPDFVLVYGDTNSTLAGALAASKLHIPVAHVEAGLRSFNKKMPEEQNRILTDHVSEFLLVPTAHAVENLRNEGLEDRAVVVGDIMYEGFLHYMNLLANRAEGRSKQLLGQDVKAGFYLLTLHRAENTDDPELMTNIFEALGELNHTVVLPLHPRTKAAMQKVRITLPPNIRVIDPVGYFDMLSLLNQCKGVLTDSGGLQKEAYFAEKLCFTLRHQTEWVETVKSGWNQLVLNKLHELPQIIHSTQRPLKHPNLYGLGNTSELILNAIAGS